MNSRKGIKKRKIRNKINAMRKKEKRKGNKMSFSEASILYYENKKL